MKKILFVIALCSRFGNAQAEDMSPVVTFTFDDAWLSQYTEVLPIMSRAGIVGTLFAITQRISHEDSWSAENYMSWAQLKEMEQAGWDVQSHTHSHPNLTQIDDSSLFGELAYSQLLLRQRLGVEANYIATPFGEFDERVMNFVTKQYQAHFRAWGGNEGFNDLTNLDPYNVGRYEVKADYTVDHVCGIVSDLHPNTWLVFEFHKVVEAQEIKPYEVSKEILEKIVDCTVVQEKLGKIRIMTANQVLEKGEW